MDTETIYKISHVVLAHKKSVDSLINEVFKTLSQDIGLKRGALTLRRGDSLFIEASIGLSPEEQKRGQYKIGEGITGRVGETGKSIVIPDISKEPFFLGRTRTKREEKAAFICVPVQHNGEVIGTLSIDTPASTGEQLCTRKKALEIIANITADGVAALKNELEEKELLEAENMRLRTELGIQYRPENIIGNCNSMKAVYGMIKQVAASNATVLIRGASGTGKELVAKAIHYASSRRTKPFVSVNCAALPESLVESELFGHEKGSFTGANYQRMGRFELADEGTLFLDEIGDISVPVQIKLLRVLQERVFERVGGSDMVKVDVRVIAATNRNLEQLMREGKFREDLYYRLNVFPINLPPLSERKSDIMPLAEFFLEKYSRLYSKKIRKISPSALNLLMAYHWPGNVRELENSIERAVIVSDLNVINANHLPPSLQTGQESSTSFIDDDSGGFRDMVFAFEKKLIAEALKKNKGSIAGAARSLKTTQRIIHYKVIKLGIEPWKYS